MDLVLLLAIMIGIGLYRIQKSGGLKEEMIIMHGDGSITIPDGHVPVGSNLSLKKEPDAFMKIVREMGLKW